MKNKLLITLAILTFSIVPFSDSTAQDGNIWQGTPCNECQNQLNFNATNASIQHFNAIFDCTPTANNNNMIGFASVMGWIEDAINGSGWGLITVAVEVFEMHDTYGECCDEANINYGNELDYIGATYCNCFASNNCGNCN